MIILGIETSCDDTCAAIIKAEPDKIKTSSPLLDLGKGRFKILSNVVSSQIKVHRKYGGVFPSLAKREHQKNLAAVIAKAISSGKIKKGKAKESAETTKRKEKELKIIFPKDDGFLKSSLSFLKKTSKPQVDALAVTMGPGLEPSLWQGINFARALSLWWELEIIPVNHIEGHILAGFIGAEKNIKLKGSDIFPAVCLVASGGHTQLILMEGIGDYKTLGESRDDAAGECLDKVARIVGLSYPGGPIIAKTAENFNPQKSKIKVSLPRPMIFAKNYDFSFSGLKTAALYEFKKQPAKIQRSKEYVKAMAFEVQESVIDVLTCKTLKAAKNFQAKSIIIGGGVTANEKLKKRFLDDISKLNPRPLFLSPDKNLSTDNAAMIASAALFNLDKTINWQNLQADANLRIG